MIKTIKLTGDLRKARIIDELRIRAGAGAPVDPHMKVKRLVAEVATEMALIHGGDWDARIDHQRRAILIAER